MGRMVTHTAHIHRLRAGVWCCVVLDSGFWGHAVVPLRYFEAVFWWASCLLCVSCGGEVTRCLARGRYGDVQYIQDRTGLYCTIQVPCCTGQCCTHSHSTAARIRHSRSESRERMTRYGAVRYGTIAH